MLINAALPSQPAAAKAPQAPTTAAPRAAAAPAHHDGLKTSEASVMRKLGTVHLAPGKDKLTIAIAPGETLSALARRWGAEDGAAAFTGAIRRANALTDNNLAAGGKLRLPYDADHAGLPLMVALAVQKDMARRGPKAPALDLKAIDVHPGPLDSYLVTAPRRDGKGLQHFAVFDDQTGEDPQRWCIQPLSAAEYAKRQRGEF